MQLGLAGKIALITGGSVGIGKVTALALAQEGAQVAICARGIEALQETAREIHATGNKVLPIRAGMTKLDDIKHLVAITAQELGDIDILVNNAVNSTPGTFLELSDEAWMNHITVKIMGYMRCTREVIPYMMRWGGGRIINIGGMAATPGRASDHKQRRDQCQCREHHQKSLGSGGTISRAGELHSSRNHANAPANHAVGASRQGSGGEHGGGGARGGATYSHRTDGGPRGHRRPDPLFGVGARQHHHRTRRCGRWLGWTRHRVLTDGIAHSLAEGWGQGEMDSPWRWSQASRHQHRRQQHASGGDPGRQRITIPADQGSDKPWGHHNCPIDQKPVHPHGPA
jgi:NAD(P)-dependent dehydrogenase (short-subunit alcohol dehydrogenase family)